MNFMTVRTTSRRQRSPPTPWPATLARAFATLAALAPSSALSVGEMSGTPTRMSSRVRVSPAILPSRTARL